MNWKEYYLAFDNHALMNELKRSQCYYLIRTNRRQI